MGLVRTWYMGIFLSTQSVLERHWHPFSRVSCGVRHTQLTLSSEQRSQGFFPSDYVWLACQVSAFLSWQGFCRLTTPPRPATHATDILLVSTIEPLNLSQAAFWRYSQAFSLVPGHFITGICLHTSSTVTCPSCLISWFLLYHHYSPFSS